MSLVYRQYRTAATNAVEWQALGLKLGFVFSSSSIDNIFPILTVEGEIKKAV
jgi:hypothetical protein